jgi:hypothetical protein
MQLATSGPETGFMYKELTFRSVSKPDRITVPGFVLPAQKEALRHCTNNDVSGQMTPGERMAGAGYFGGLNLRLKNRL